MKHKFGKNNNYFSYDLNFENNDDKYGVLKFSQCDEKFPLQELQKDELKSFVSFAKIFESLPWRRIKTYSGLKFENIPEINKPDTLEKDITLSSIRVTQKFRIIGYRQEQYFYIVWFDRNHQAYKS
jgi:hypothetical protein